MLAAPTRSARTTFVSQTRALSYSAVTSKPHFESHSSQTPQPPPHYAPPSSSQSPGSPAPRRSRLSPAPRPAPPMEPGMRIPALPPQFGRNQVLDVPDRTRALLEEIVAGFQAPIRYAFAYGSGVFGQDGYKDSVSVALNPLLYVSLVARAMFYIISLGRVILDFNADFPIFIGSPSARFSFRCNTRGPLPFHQPAPKPEALCTRTTPTRLRLCLSCAGPCSWVVVQPIR